jgi:site-specific DNA recombinase
VALGSTVRTEDAAAATINLAIAAELRRAGQGKRIVIGESSDGASNSSLVRALQEAFLAREALLAHSNESLNAITLRLTKSKGRLTALMRVSYLAPDIINDILAGRQPPELSPKRLLRTSQGLPLDWKEQRSFLRFA